MIKHMISIIGILLLSGCASERKNKHERDKALERVRQSMVYPIGPQSEYTASILTRNIAVSTALQNNSKLQANFEQLGIGTAELEKAGVFTNPYLDAIFAFPRDKTMNPALTFYLGILKVSDLWLIPIKRKIAEDELEIISWEVTTHALKVIRDTQLAYNACVHAALTLNITQEHTQALQAITTTTALSPDDNLVMNVKRQIDSLKNASHKRTVIIHLQHLMGISVNLDTQLEEVFIIPNDKQLSDIETLIQQTQLAQHPTMIISQIRTMRAQHQLSYERRRCMEDITLGYNYVSWFDGVAGSGPFFHMGFPIGDTTHAGQRKARATIAQCEQETQAILQSLHMEAEKLFISLTSTAKQIELMSQELKPHIIKQLHAHKHDFEARATEQNKQALLAALQLYYETEQNYINLLCSYHDTLIKLDYLVGGGILKKIYSDKNSCA